MRSSIAREILAYLVEHPNAQDTVEGIAEWWLLERRIQQDVPRVKAALAELTERGLIRKRKGKDSSVRYQLDQERLQEIKNLLERNRLKQDEDT